MKAAFLGAGNMGSALIQGSLKAKILMPTEIFGYDVRPELLKVLKKKSGIQIAKSVTEAAFKADYIFLCVKPQQMWDLVAELKNILTSGQCLITIAAGITTERFSAALLPKEVSVVRVMPNTPAMIGMGASAVCGGKFARPGDIKFAVKFFSSVGKAVVLPESSFDAETAVAGSGPAYVFYLAESMIRAARELGLSEDAAKVLVYQTIQGASQMLGGEDSPEDLRRKVTSPGGTTEAAVQHLESQNWQQIFVDAVRKAKERSEKLRSI